MAKFQPFQCLVACPQRRVMLAASGFRLFGISLDDWTIATIWPQHSDAPAKETFDSPPEKKRKLFAETSQQPNIIKLAVSEDQSYVVVVTGEDKCIRVFKFEENNLMVPLSERCMLKRPCAVVITPDSSAILCADKFGDVYSVPLLWSPEEEQDDAAAKENQEVQQQKKFVPSASTLTVHSGRNRKALQMQLEQAHKWVKTKEPLKFKHDLLLGHVSMLTDIAFISTSLYPGSKGSMEKDRLRSYVITADRDEHIRVSRGPPQAHIIEGYCLGHTEFVNKLCVYDDELLLSGGGDNDIFLWNWRLCRLLKKIDLKSSLDAYIDQNAPKTAADDPEHSDRKVAVTGVWKLKNEDAEKSVGSTAFYLSTRQETLTCRQPDILVACEGISALFHIPAGALGIEKEANLTTINLDGNVIDIAILSPSFVVVSIDNVHEKCSKTQPRKNLENPCPRMQHLELGRRDSSIEWIVKDQALERLDKIDQDVVKEDNLKSLRTLIYGTEELRKRGFED